ncbi:MAG: 5-oxoprolinase subunit PxpA [Hydrogenophilaceae bacterium]|nr:5-oxoprolinase subunit PxpA [Hydrogenophilaceae bacterium]
MIELNADIGEGGPDAVLMPYVDRVSIACGGHAGDVASMRQALLLARDYGIKPGAHPGYPDPANFGRKAMAAGPAQITRWVVEQTLTLQRVAHALDMTLFHVKPHGALYNLAAGDRVIGKAVIAALQELGGLALIVLAGSPLAEWARVAGLEVIEEAFADRRYLENGRLAPREMPGAVINKPEEAAHQAALIAQEEPVVTLNGQLRVIRAQTLCVHGDGPGALERAKAVARALQSATN